MERRLWGGVRVRCVPPLLCIGRALMNVVEQFRLRHQKTAKITNTSLNPPSRFRAFLCRPSRLSLRRAPGPPPPSRPTSSSNRILRSPRTLSPPSPPPLSPSPRQRRRRPPHLPSCPTRPPPRPPPTPAPPLSPPFSLPRPRVSTLHSLSPSPPSLSSTNRTPSPLMSSPLLLPRFQQQSSSRPSSSPPPSSRRSRKASSTSAAGLTRSGARGRTAVDCCTMGRTSRVRRAGELGEFVRRRFGRSLFFRFFLCRSKLCFSTHSPPPPPPSLLYHRPPLVSPYTSIEVAKQT